MRQRTVLAALLAWIALALAAPLPALAETRLEIISPREGERLRGRVPIIGSAQVPDFQFYKVEFGLGPNPTQWSVIGILHEQPVINGQLEVWDTTALPDDVYTLKLTGVRRDGNWQDVQVRNVVIANRAPEPTPTPDVTPTPEVELLPTPVGATPTPVADPALMQPTPEATPGVGIIAPIAPEAAATPTPRVGQQAQENRLPIETDVLGQSLCFGGAAMGAVFVLLGIVFGIRRLL